MAGSRKAESRISGNRKRQEKGKGAQRESGAFFCGWKRESFTDIYGEMTKESPILLDNIVSKKTMEIKTASVSIKVDAERSHLISERLIDGKKCLVVDIDGEAVEVNGVIISQTADISEG